MSTSPRIDAVLGRLSEQGRELSERSCPQALVDCPGCLADRNAKEVKL